MEFKFKGGKKLPDIDDALLESDSDQEEHEDHHEMPKEDIVDHTDYTGEPDGQSELEHACERQCESNYLNPVLKFDVPFEGDLDFAFLTKNTTKKGQVREIYFHQSGKIKSLKNLPDTIHVLYCPGQELKTIDPLPRNLKTLHIPKNRIESLDLGKTPELKSLNVSENEIHTISNIPASLEELRTTQNPRLTLLDLEEPYMISKSLKVLETDPHVVLKNFDYEEFTKNHPKEHGLDKVRKGRGRRGSKGGAGDEADDDDSPPYEPKSAPKITFEDAINKYFEYKNQYEQSERNLKKLNRALLGKKGSKKTTKKPKLPKCIKCNQAVGMTFKRDGPFYIAKCGIGSKYSCDFHLEIKSPDAVDLIQELEEVYHTYQSNKDNIIRMKMDNLFGYETDKDTVKNFKDEMGKYKMNNEFTELMISEYQNIFGKNLEKEFFLETVDKEYQEFKRQYQEMIEEFKRDPLNHALIDDAMELYVTQMRPKRVEWLRMLYPTMEMNPVPMKKEFHFIGGGIPVVPSKLFYSHVNSNFYSHEYEKGAAFTFDE
jgi:hypothetical protein